MRLFSVLQGLVCVLAATGAHSETSNVLINPGFADGVVKPKGWDFNVPPGSKVLWQVSDDRKTHAILMEAGGTDWAGLSSHAVKTAPGEVLAVLGWISQSPEAPGTEQDHLYVRFFNKGIFVGQDGPSLGALKEGWQFLCGSVRVPENVDQADVSVQIRSQSRLRVASLGLVRGEAGPHPQGLLPDPPGLNVAWKTIDKPQDLYVDQDKNGLPDELEAFLGVRPEDRAVSVRQTRKKTTSFQTGGGYREDNDLKVDIVIVAGNSEESIRSWTDMGYETHVMVGFRAGQDYLDGQADGVNHEDEVQTNVSGKPLTCGPGSFYMVPTKNRRKIFQKYFEDAVRRGAKAACPEEPEFFSQAGYSAAFKREWLAAYRESWQDPSSSVEVRFDAERLKVELERDLLRACYEGAREADPNIPRFLLAHSPLNYTAWGICFGHADMLQSGEVDAMIAQVWTGTARTPIRYEGLNKERTFENAYLEYASCLGLTRGTDVTLWFLMDPLEDHPDRTMEDYKGNYERTLVASLMFPEVIHFETMPWPTRIFGRVPDEFATEICSVLNVLSDMQNQTDVRPEWGTEGIGTFLSDSAMWQRGQPHPSDMACFYGLTLPLLMRGIPVEVPHLDRMIEGGSLTRFKVLLVSYDMLKPMKPEMNEVLASWVRAGGCLIVLGGEDAYNEVPEWWREEGFESPQDHLLSLCGFEVFKRKVIQRESMEEGGVFRASGHATPLGSATVSVPGRSPLVLYEDSTASPLYAIQDQTLLSEKKLGQGWVLFFGASPSVFAQSPEAADQLRALVRYALEEKRHLPYTEKGALRLDRGRYTIVKTLEGSMKLEGQYINVLDPCLPLITQVSLGPDQVALLYDASQDLKELPRILFCSSCVLWQSEEKSRIRLIASGASGTFGTCRLYGAERHMQSLSCISVGGQPVSVEVKVEGKTVLLRYPNDPLGLALDVRFDP